LNVQFLQFDITQDPINEYFDLIFCSEVLYYVGSVRDLQQIASKIVAALKPGGYLITTNDLRVKNHTSKSVSPNSRLFGAKVISEILSKTSPLQLCNEIRTPFYYTQLFQHQEEGYLTSPKQPCKAIEFTQSEIPLKEKSVFDLFYIVNIYNAWCLFKETLSKRALW
jgi:SAM-dependent methyltransferase